MGMKILSWPALFVSKKTIFRFRLCKNVFIDWILSKCHLYYWYDKSRINGQRRDQIIDYEKKAIGTLLKFLDYIFSLPEELERQLKQEIIILEEESKMAYVTSWEKIARKDGIKTRKTIGVRGVRLYMITHSSLLSC